MDVLIIVQLFCVKLNCHTNHQSRKDRLFVATGFWWAPNLHDLQTFRALAPTFRHLDHQWDVRGEVGHARWRHHEVVGCGWAQLHSGGSREWHVHQLDQIVGTADAGEDWMFVYLGSPRGKTVFYFFFSGGVGKRLGIHIMSMMCCFFWFCIVCTIVLKLSLVYLLVHFSRGQWQYDYANGDIGDCLMVMSHWLIIHPQQLAMHQLAWWFLYVLVMLKVKSVRCSSLCLFKLHVKSVIKGSLEVLTSDYTESCR